MEGFEEGFEEEGFAEDTGVLRLRRRVLRTVLRVLRGASSHHAEDVCLRYDDHDLLLRRRDRGGFRDLHESERSASFFNMRRDRKERQRPRRGRRFCCWDRVEGETAGDITPGSCSR